MDEINNQTVNSPDIQSPTNIQSPKNKTKKINKKWINLGLALLFILSLGISGSFLYLQKNALKTTPSPTPTTADETASWKTYTNSILSLQYPSSYKIEINTQYINIYDKEENLGPNNLYLSIDYSLKGVLSDYTETVKKWSVRENAEKINLPNGFKLIYSDKNGQVYQVDTFLKYKQGAIRAFYRITPEIPSKTYDEIISTIKFTDPDETANWNLYSNPDMKITLKYPSDAVIDRNEDYVVTLAKKSEANIDFRSRSIRLDIYEQEIATTCPTCKEITTGNLKGWVYEDGFYMLPHPYKKGKYLDVRLWQSDTSPADNETFETIVSTLTAFP